MVKPFTQAGPDISAKMLKIATAIERGNKETLRSALMAGKAEHANVIVAHSGGDSRLSRMGRRGARVGVRFDVRSTGSDQSGELKATGPLHILANPTKSHMIPRVRSRGRRRVLAIPGIGVRVSANHPGTKGKDTWQEGRKAAEPVIQRELSRRTTTIIRAAM